LPSAQLPSAQVDIPTLTVGESGTRHFHIWNVAGQILAAFDQRYFGPTGFFPVGPLCFMAVPASVGGRRESNQGFMGRC
jgi:hypothetical protein